MFIDIGLLALVSGIVALTNGGPIAAVGFAVDQSERRKGFKKGEGSGTQKETMTLSESGDDFGKFLTQLADMFPDSGLKKHVGKLFLFTKSENEHVRTMLIGVQSTIASLQSMDDSCRIFLRSMIANGASDAEIADTMEGAKQVALTIREAASNNIRPLVEYLDGFPKPRVKKAS